MASKLRCALSAAALITILVIFAQDKRISDSDKPRNHQDANNVAVNNKNEAQRIFFVESSGKRDLNARQACSIESASRHHKNSDITVYMGNRLGFVPNNPYSKIIRTLANVHIDYINVSLATKGTSLEKWISNDSWKKTSFMTEHSSDIIRYGLLWKHGGIYLDLDVMVIRDMSNLSNYVSADKESGLSGAVMMFEPHHKITAQFLESVPEAFNENVYGAIGPLLVTKVFKSVCQEENLNLMTPVKCHGAKVLPKSSFYLVPWNRWKELFQSDLAGKLLDETIREKSYAVHFYNKMSHDWKMKFNTYSLIEILAKNHCPQVYQESVTQGSF